MELGAPIRNFITKEESKKLVDTAKSENRIEEYENELIKYHNTIIGDMVYCIPTAKQMIEKACELYKKELREIIDTFNKIGEMRGINELGDILSFEGCVKDFIKAMEL